MCITTVTSYRVGEGFAPPFNQTLVSGGRVTSGNVTDNGLVQLQRKNNNITLKNLNQIVCLKSNSPILYLDNGVCERVSDDVEQVRGVLSALDVE